MCRCCRGLVLVTWLWAGAAQGAGAGAGFREQVAAAVELYRQGDYRAAIAAFERAYQLRQAPRILYNLGQAYRQLGENARALEHYQAYLDQAKALQQEHRAEVERMVAELRAAQKDPAQTAAGQKDPAPQPAQPAALKGVAPAGVPAGEPHRRTVWGRPLWRVTAGALGLLGGAALIGVGAWGLSLDGQCADGPGCAQQYDTLPAGGAVTGLGAALLVTGLVLLALPGRAAAVAPGASQGGLALSGRF